ncbi:MaoC family dehydratase N-terminal domain-containing protein [Desulfallas sp. Bu1-1]|uniref:FAS1-like dehydratase domain-containing protein n=1 Tax=Desulfallas sp. Bu1-1 TaxID=2787620 RepID=UPI00189D299A|nr:MaoC family dehydratase N-terminal domain-containing protein [Desulfallas sp. Bu1-1]MBF7084307.1 MaoC family dehydratase N-terminal domain-containing protein [Desulfallas sp. Bu1-1]
MAEIIASMAEGRITEEALAKFRERIGIKLRINNIFNEWVTADSVRHFVDGIGDPNPLWVDEEYARKTAWGGLIAPPSILHSIFPGWVLQGLPGVQGFHTGSEWTFYKPARLGDKITPECVFTGFEEKKSTFAGRMIMEYQESKYYNQDNELLAKVNLWITRVEREASRSKGKYSGIQLPHPWTEEELARVEEAVLNEEIRGGRVRYWEDVQEGEELPPVVKGPLGLTDMVAFCIGAAPIKIQAHGLSLRNYRRHPAWAFRDKETSALEPIYSVHYNKSAALAVGVPYPYDVGVQRHCWLIHLLTNWIGDDGWLKKCYAEYRKFVYFSDVVWMKGKVTRKYIDEDGEYAVDIETHGINQRGEDTIPGHSTVVLPSREAGTSPVARRRRK